MSAIKSQLTNDNYRKGWDQIFGKKDSWTTGRSMLAIRAIQVMSEATSLSCDEVAKSQDWKNYLYSVN